MLSYLFPLIVCKWNIPKMSIKVVCTNECRRRRLLLLLSSNRKWKDSCHIYIAKKIKNQKTHFIFFLAFYGDDQNYDWKIIFFIMILTSINKYQSITYFYQNQKNSVFRQINIRLASRNCFCLYFLFLMFKWIWKYQYNFN